jgi:hypothetical protein
MEPTEPQYSTTTKLARIAWLFGRDPLKKVDAQEVYVGYPSILLI